MCGKKLSKRWKKSERRYRVKFTDSGAYLRALKRSRLLYLFSRYCQSLFFNAAHRSLKLRWAQEIRPAFGMMSSCSWKGRIWNPSSEYADHNSILCFFLVSYLLDFYEKNPQKESRPKKRNGLQKISCGLLCFTVLISNDVALNSDCFRRYSTNPWIAFSYRNVFSGSASAVS